MADKLTLHHGDCLEVLRSLPDCSIDSIVTDPPYGLSFMGKRWDYDVPSVDVWAECLRVLKPGGHLLAFAGTRTQHRMAVRIEDAGFEIRDMIAWVYGSGFPKSLDVSKAIDKAAGVEFDALPAIGVGFMNANGAGGYNVTKNQLVRKGERTPEAKQWQGWGTALKPALEPITVARKPLIGTVAENVLQHGTGAINVDGGRVGTEQRYNPPAGNKAGGNSLNMSAVGMPEDADGRTAAGRWPANFIHDGSEEATDLLGVSARFFYCAKASKADRGENHHPTVKPTDLMRYLCRLVTPPSGIVLDPFMGSGSTGKAAMLEGFAFVGIEREEEYINIAKARIQSAVGLL
jgi:site-specific DNA-methyltransferase (adenine-specific)